MPILKHPNIVSEVADFSCETTRPMPDTSVQYSRRLAGSEDPIRDYLHQIGQVPLLTFEQEQQFGIEVQTGLAAEQRLSAQVLSAGERVRLADKVQAGLEAENTMISANLRLVVSVARRYSQQGVDLLDLIQEGNIGLMRAVRLFKPEKGYKFSTYASTRIRGAIVSGFSENLGSIKMGWRPRGLIRLLSDLELQRDSRGNPLTAAQIEYLSGLTPEEQDEVRGWRASSSTLRLDEPLTGSDGSAYDVIEDKYAERVSILAIRNNTAQAAQDLFSVILPDVLSSDELMALQKRLGTGDQTEEVSSNVTNHYYIKARSKLLHPFMAQLLDRGLLPARDAWKFQAECKDSRVEWIFPHIRKGQSLASRRAQNHIIETLCSVCPVRERCASVAASQKTTCGVWGGRIYGTKGSPLN